MAWLMGRKTYILAALGAAAFFGQLMGWWAVPEEVWGILGFGTAAAMRAGIARKP